MLTESEVASLRASVAVAHMRRRFTGKVDRLQFKDGPLAGIEMIIDSAAARSLYIGWCIVTRTGPVQVLYKHARAVGELPFAEYFTGSR